MKNVDFVHFDVLKIFFTLRLLPFALFRRYMDSQRAILTDEWEILPTSITLNEKIGEGAFGAIFSAFVGFKNIEKSKYVKLKGKSAALGDKNYKVVVKLLKGKISACSIFSNSVTFHIQELVECLLLGFLQHMLTIWSWMIFARRQN